MTRRDRAALALAYECLRHDVDSDSVLVAVLQVTDILEHGTNGLYRNFGRHLDAAYRDAHGNDMGRLLRARLALALRALLRAERGDYGPTRFWCRRSSSHRTSEWLHLNDAWCIDCTMDVAETVVIRDVFRGAQRITPLWATAPAAGTGVRPDGLGRRA